MASNVADMNEKKEKKDQLVSNVNDKEEKEGPIPDAENGVQSQINQIIQPKLDVKPALTTKKEEKKVDYYAPPVQSGIMEWLKGMPMEVHLLLFLLWPVGIVVWGKALSENSRYKDALDAYSKWRMKAEAGEDESSTAENRQFTIKELQDNLTKALESSDISEADKAALRELKDLLDKAVAEQGLDVNQKLTLPEETVVKETATQTSAGVVGRTTTKSQVSYASLEKAIRGACEPKKEFEPGEGRKESDSVLSFSSSSSSSG